jgi:hypothetical protein
MRIGKYVGQKFSYRPHERMDRGEPDLLPVHLFVTLSTQGYQILVYVISQSAPRLNMVDLEATQPTAPLTAPSISLQNLLV